MCGRCEDAFCMSHFCVKIIFSHECFFFKQKTAYEMRISDWSSDVCSSDLLGTSALCSLRWQTAKPLSTASQWRGAPGSSVTKLVKTRSSEERRVGKESVCTCRYRRTPSQ